jgi:hypothetical protein
VFTLACVFLGIAGLLVAALSCLSVGRRARQYAEVDFDTLRAASVCISEGRRAAADGATATTDNEPTQDEKAKWQEMKAVWMQCYGRCQEKAILKQKAMCQLASTLALCAMLSLVGVLLEVVFCEPISIRNIVAGFRHPHPAATSSQTPQSPGEKDTSQFGN